MPDASGKKGMNPILARVQYSRTSSLWRLTRLYIFWTVTTGLPSQGFPVLSFPCILACFAGHFLYIFAVFAGEACKNSKNIPFASAVGAKSAENGKALVAFPLLLSLKLN